MARQKKLTPEQEKEIKLLQANNEMLENTKEEAKLRGTQNAVKRIEIAQEDVIAQIAKIDEDIAKETASRTATKKPQKENVVTKEVDKEVFENTYVVKKEEKRNEPTVKLEPKLNQNVFNEIPNDVQYDIISLPSNGECYKNKIGRIPVGYLTAYDENFLTSPNLYQDGLVIDYLLKNKILDNNFDLDNMCSGDADAVILFLRATSYGADFPISVKDPKSGTRFDTVIDLTQFKNKEFNLQGDENGYFTYILPLTKHEIKFRYLSRKDEKELEMLSELETQNGRSIELRTVGRKLKTILNKDRDNELSDDNGKAIEQILKWADSINNVDETPINQLITHRMEKNIVAVNGNTDRDFIKNYIKNMPARDSFMLRRYITANEPGIDWKITVERPQSLGGGSFETFLSWDDTVFFNISDSGTIS